MSELDKNRLQDAAYMAQRIAACEAEIQKGIIGQHEVIREVMLAMLTGGNVLLEGMPGLGKTRLVSTIGKVFDLPFKRIQFTPDLMPSDVTGTNIIMKGEQGSRFSFVRGPIFANLILADEINRATPKTQSALLEAMQEHTVTVGGEGLLAAQALVNQIPIAEAVMDYLLELVMATHAQNPYIREGASPRAAQALIRAARAKAFLEGRFNVSFQDVQEAAYPVLRHRIIPSFDAVSAGVSEDDIIKQILDTNKNT